MLMSSDFMLLFPSKRGWESVLLCPGGCAAYLQTVVLILSFVKQVLLPGCFLCAYLLHLW